MKAHQGDRIILAAKHIEEATRDGEVLEVRGADGDPTYLVRWSDGHTGLLYPGPGSVLRVGHEHEQVVGPPAEPSEVSVDGLVEGVAEHALSHAREWQVRVSIFESGDDTSATAVLLSDAPTHLTARGDSHRSAKDTLVPQIGDEVAVARALRHLADQLIEAAEQDIEVATGRDAYIRPS